MPIPGAIIQYSKIAFMSHIFSDVVFDFIICFTVKHFKVCSILSAVFNERKIYLCYITYTFPNTTCLGSCSRWGLKSFKTQSNTLSTVSLVLKGFTVILKFVLSSD